MKKIFFRILFMYLCGFMSSCKKENKDSVSDQKTVCYNIVDGITNAPLQGVYVSAAFDWNDVPYTYSGTTDASGNFCLETFSTATETQLVASASGYVNVCYHFPGSIVYLTPVAYLQLHIKNILPANNMDEIFITYPGTDCNGSSGLHYGGYNVDTTVVVPANPLGNHVSWTSWHNSVSTDSMYNGISMSSHDTTFFELLY